MKKILEKSGNFVRGKKWEPWLLFQMNLMKEIRDSIKDDRFPEFVQTFFSTMFPDKNYPLWAVNALASVNVHLN